MKVKTKEKMKSRKQKNNALKKQLGDLQTEYEILVRTHQMEKAFLEREIQRLEAEKRKLEEKRNCTIV